MKTVFVHFWGYKSKQLPEAVNALISNQSGQNKIIVSVYDQTNVARPDKFNADMYEHVFWDSLQSPYELLNNSIRTTDTDFFMYVDGAVYFEPNWDLELVMGHGGRNVVISGNTNVRFGNEYKFYPSYQKEPSNTANITNWVSHDFVFMTTEMFKQFPDISLLKYIGFEDVYSLYATHMNIPVQSIPTPWFKRIDGGIFENEYIPFSIKHNYELVIDIYKGKQNIFFNDLLCVNKLSQAIQFDLSRLNYLPYPHNDVSYNPRMELDETSAERFSQKIRTIQ